MYACTYICVCMYIYIYIERDVYTCLYVILYEELSTFSPSVLSNNIF